MANKLGRKPLLPSERRSERVTLFFTMPQFKRALRAAKANEFDSIAAWAESWVNAQANAVTGTPARGQW